jgi:hypothetical protein
MADGRRSSALLARHGVDFIQPEINAIDPARRGADTSLAVGLTAIISW